MKNKFDYIIIGSGLAGLTTALILSGSGSVAVITKKKRFDSSTNLAQGGVAAVIGKKDSIAWHVEDTLRVGQYHNKKTAVTLLVKNSRAAILWLKKQGVLFDTVPSLEAGHRLARVVHTSDFTGQDIENTILKRVKEKKRIRIFEDTRAVDLIVENNVCRGVFILSRDNEIVPYFAKAVVLATGGVGQIYQWTTNPSISTGDGIAIAKRAGAEVSDLEFIQFHPTALKYKVFPLFLLSERLRGEGAYLIDEKGSRFVDELASRDKLARAVYGKQKKSEVYLTMAHLDKKEIIKKLPNIYKRLKTYGYDLTKDRIPVTPAAHYQCGGITADLDGKTSVENLFAAGEVANTGVHGANRLASNSLLEAVVFGKQTGIYIKKHQRSPLRPSGFEGQAKREINVIFNKKEKSLLKKIETDVKKIMWEKVGIVRKKKELLEALNQFEDFKKRINTINVVNNLKTDENLKIKGDCGAFRKLIETGNLIDLAVIITEAALARPKSLGAHYIL